MTTLIGASNPEPARILASLAKLRVDAGPVILERKWCESPKSAVEGATI
jgi:hypothetical protein